MVLLIFVACGGRKEPADIFKNAEEDRQAKQMLQGIWVNDEDETPAMRVQGDTIFYPDSTSLPVTFQIFGDTLVLHGASDARYPIVRQSAHIFEFRNQNGDLIKLIKSDEKEDLADFTSDEPQAINQSQLIKRDTVLHINGKRYHCYVQVNPTTFKVYKTTYNSEGVSVDNIYYDNIINLAVFQGEKRLFSSDFRKADFSRFIDEKQLKQCILSDMLFKKTDDEGIHYDAFISVPDSPIGYVVDVVVAFDGKVTMRL
ncbi:MAG: DUF4738 domain-containing protein [Prevotella sp.]|nr:DUF4738 domain-containing protein [Prevotella sp.]